MADAVVSFVVNKLGDLLVEEVKFLCRVNDQIELIKIQLNVIKCFLCDADSKKKSDERVKRWVQDVRNVSYEIENAIDTFLVEMHRTDGKHLSLAERLKCKPAKLLARHKLGDKLTLIKKKIDEITASRSTYGIKNLGEDVAEERPLRRLVLPNIDDVEVVGFDAEKKSILEALVNGSSTQTRRVISIVGPGGLGKTTLAKKIYNDSIVKVHFEICIWLSISQNFRPIDILKKIYGQATGVESKEVQEDEVYISEKIYESLRKKKYLIFLDDVWDENIFAFLHAALPDVKNGSRVLITTRIGYVAKCATLNDEYQLPYLNKEESLMLFLKKAFRNCDSSVHCPDELMDLAVQLAERCSGLPLALGALANFPEDSKITAKSLTRMWIAEGLVANKKRVIEDDAEDCLEELAQRSLIQVLSRYQNGQIKEIMVHDLLRDLAIQEAQESDFLLICKVDSLSGNLDAPRRILLCNYCGGYDRLEKINMCNLRSVIQFGFRFLPMGLGFLLVRVLELQGTKNVNPPNELKNMVHLRYLGLANTNTFNIPETIGCLQNFQTLDIRKTNVTSIPDSLWKVSTLRHIRGSDRGFDGPPSSANLVNLRTLKWCLVPVSWKEGLPHMPHLRRLEIHLCRYDVEENDYEDCEWALRWQSVANLLTNLKDLLSLHMQGHHLPTMVFDARTSPSYQNLQSLTLDGYRCTRLSFGDVQMPPNLIKLKLGGFYSKQDPMPTLEKLRCLRDLIVYNVEGLSKMICSAKGFPQLKQLQIYKLFSLNEWNVEEEAMPRLTSLSIVECEEILVLPDLQHVTTLKELNLRTMSDEFVSWIQDSGEDLYKIQHIPLVKISDF